MESNNSQVHSINLKDMLHPFTINMSLNDQDLGQPTNEQVLKDNLELILVAIYSIICILGLIINIILIAVILGRKF